MAFNLNSISRDGNSSRQSDEKLDEFGLPEIIGSKDVDKSGSDLDEYGLPEILSSSSPGRKEPSKYKPSTTATTSVPEAPTQTIKSTVASTAPTTTTAPSSTQPSNATHEPSNDFGTYASDYYSSINSLIEDGNKNGFSASAVKTMKDMSAEFSGRVQSMIDSGQYNGEHLDNLKKAKQGADELYANAEKSSVRTTRPAYTGDKDKGDAAIDWMKANNHTASTSIKPNYYKRGAVKYNGVSVPYYVEDNGTKVFSRSSISKALQQGHSFFSRNIGKADFDKFAKSNGGRWVDDDKYDPNNTLGRAMSAASSGKSEVFGALESIYTAYPDDLDKWRGRGYKAVMQHVQDWQKGKATELMASLTPEMRQAVIAQNKSIASKYGNQRDQIYSIFGNGNLSEVEMERQAKGIIDKLPTGARYAMQDTLEDARTHSKYWAAREEKKASERAVYQQKKMDAGKYNAMQNADWWSGDEGAYSSIIADSQRSVERTTRDIAESTEKTLAEFRKEQQKGDTWYNKSVRGARDVAFDPHTWLAGVLDYYDQSNIKAAVNASENGKATEAQEELLEALGSKMAVDAMYQNKLSGWYTSAGSATESIAFMLEMLVDPAGGALSKAAGGAAKSIAKAIVKTTLKRLASKGITTAALKSAPAVSKILGAGVKASTKIEQAIGKVGSKIGTVVPEGMGEAISSLASIGKGAAKTLGKDVSRTLGQEVIVGGAHVAADYDERTTGKVYANISGEGTSGYNIDNSEKQDWKTAIKDAFVNDFSGRLTERFGDHMPFIDEWIGRATGGFFSGAANISQDIVLETMRKMGMKNMPDVLEGLAKNKYKRVLNGWANRVKLNGLGGEYAEEFINNAIVAAFTDDMDFGTGEKGIFNAKTNVDILSSLAWMTGGHSVLSFSTYPIAYVGAQRCINKLVNDADRMLFGDRFDSMVDDINNASADELSTMYLKYVTETTKKGENAANVQRATWIAKYITAVAKMKGIMDVDSTMRDSKSDEQNEAEDNVNSAYGEGANAETSEERKNIVLHMEDAEAKMGSLIDDDTTMDDYVAMYGDTPSQQLQAIQESDIEQDKKDALTQYIIAQARYNGMMDGAQADVDEKVSAAVNEVNANVHGATNSIVQATYGDQTGYVIVGNYNGDGNESLWLRLDDGSVVQTTRSQALDISAENADDVRYSVASSIREEYEQQLADSMQPTEQERAAHADQQAKQQIKQQEQDVEDEQERQQHQLQSASESGLRRDESGKPMYEESGVYATLNDSTVADRDNDTRATWIANKQRTALQRVNEAQAAYDAVEKSKPSMDEFGDDIEEYAAAEDKWKEDIQSAQRAVDESRKSVEFWKQVRDENNARNGVSNKERADVIGVDKAIIDALEQLADTLGMQIVYDDYIDVGGNNLINASVDHNKRQVHISIHSLLKGKGFAMLIGHEIFHSLYRGAIARGQVRRAQEIKNVAKKMLGDNWDKQYIDKFTAYTVQETRNAFGDEMANIVYEELEEKPATVEEAKAILYRISRDLLGENEEKAKEFAKHVNDKIEEEITCDFVGNTISNKRLLSDLVGQSRSLAERIIDALVDIANRLLGSGKQHEAQMLDGVIGNLKELVVESSSEVTPIEDDILYEESQGDTDNSIDTLFEAVGMQWRKEEGGLGVFTDAEGNELTEITEDMVRNSPMGIGIHKCVTDGLITKADEKKQIKFFAETFNEILKTKDVDLVFAVSGALPFGNELAPGMRDLMTTDYGQPSKFFAKTSNSDPQYSTTFDVTTVCLKTKPVIDAISGTMKKLGRGLTPEEIIGVVYDEAAKAGEPVPCPVCYVFSRWVGNGKILDNMRKWQEEFGEMDDSEVIDAINDATAMVERVREEWGYDADGKLHSFGQSKNRAIDQRLTKIAKILDKSKSEVRKAIDDGKLREVLSATSEKLEYAEFIGKYGKQKGESRPLKLTKENKEFLQTLNADIEILDALTWMQRVRMCGVQDNSKNGKGKWAYHPERFKPVDINVLLDFNAGAEFATKYPEAWAYRTSRGSAAGKAITPYAPEHFGQFMMPEGDGNKNLANPKRNYFLNPTKKTKPGEYGAQANKDINSQRVKARAQNLIGGQRMQSTSDYRPEYMTDYLIAFLELQILGSKVQLYTKVPEAVAFLAGAGAECNLSLMAYEDGFLLLDPSWNEDRLKREVDAMLSNGMKYDDIFKRLMSEGKIKARYSPLTGMNADDAFMLASMFDNVQPIIVGINDTHMHLMLASDNITFIIPYHASGSTEERYKSMMKSIEEHVMKRDDYTDYQGDKHIGTADGSREYKIRCKILSGYANGKGSKKNTEGKKLTDEEKEIVEKFAIDGYDAHGNPVKINILHDLYKRFYGTDVYGNSVSMEDKERLFGTDANGRVREFDEECFGVHLASEQAKQIFPYEYWNKTLTRDQAHLNGNTFLSYCAMMDISPRFSGYKKVGQKMIYNEEKDFTGDKGYWKTLIDRPMYNNDGTYHEPKAINISGIPSNFVHNSAVRTESEGTTGEYYGVDGYRFKNPSRPGNPSKNKKIVENSVRRIQNNDYSISQDEERAIDIRKNQFGSNYDFSIAGVAGAENLDKKDKKNRMQNLEVAKKMYDDGKSPEDIHYATGWDMGVDGKWRYEMPDPKVQPALDSFSSSYNITDIIDPKDPIFTAYPFLKEVEVSYNGRYTTIAGSASYSKKTITLTRDCLHCGDNYAYDRWHQREIWNKQNAANRKAEEMPEDKKEKALEKVKPSKFKDGLGVYGFLKLHKARSVNTLADEFIPEYYERVHEQNRRTYEYAKNLFKNEEDVAYYLGYHGIPYITDYGYMTIIHEVQHMIQSYEGFSEGASVRDKDYNEVAGEVESRNVEARSKMSPKKRKETPLYATEDVERSKQVLRMADKPSYKAGESPLEYAERLHDWNASNEDYSISTELDETHPYWRNQTTSSGKHSTQVAITTNTYKHIGEWLRENGMHDAEILDASSGLGEGTRALREMGFDVDDVEPYQSTERKEGDNSATYESYDDIGHKYDVVISNAVINVIPDDWREDLIRTMADKVKDGGIMFINARSADEIKRISNKEILDDESEVLVNRGGGVYAYQKGWTKQGLKDYVQGILGAGWNVEVANSNNSGIKNGTPVVCHKISGGGNGGGIDYSIDWSRNRGYTQRGNGDRISKNALYAEEEGKFTQGRFRQVYGIDKKTFDMLIDAGLIETKEWHHTGSSFNKSDYYSWVDSDSIDYGEEYDGLFPEGSLAKAIRDNIDKIKEIAKRYSKAKWEYIPKRRKAMSEDEIKEYYVKDNFEKVLTPEELEERKNRHANISATGSPYDSSYERAQRREQHEEVDMRFREIATRRVEENPEQYVGDKLREESSLRKQNEDIDKHNAETDGKEKILHELSDYIPEMRYYNIEESIEKSSLEKSMEERRNMEEVANKDVYQEKEDYIKSLDNEIAETSKAEDKWLKSALKSGRAQFVERISENEKGEYFASTKEEMHGKYGWFEASYYNLPIYYTGYKFADKRALNHYNEFEKKKNRLDAMKSIRFTPSIEKKVFPSIEDGESVQDYIARRDAWISKYITKDGNVDYSISLPSNATEHPRVAVNINRGGNTHDYVSMIIDGNKTIETRPATVDADGNVSGPWDSLYNRGERVAIVETGNGAPRVRGYANIIGRVVYNTKEEWDADQDKHLASGQYGWNGVPKVGYVLGDVVEEKNDVTPEGLKGRSYSNVDYSISDKPTYREGENPVDYASRISFWDKNGMIDSMEWVKANDRGEDVPVLTINNIAEFMWNLQKAPSPFYYLHKISSQARGMGQSASEDGARIVELGDDDVKKQAEDRINEMQSYAVRCIRILSDAKRNATPVAKERLNSEIDRINNAINWYKKVSAYGRRALVSTPDYSINTDPVSAHREDAMRMDEVQRIYDEATTRMGLHKFMTDGWRKGLYNELAEGWYDYLRSVEAMQKAISEVDGRSIKDNENVYLRALHNSSINQEEWASMMRMYANPLMEHVGSICDKHGVSLDDVETYLNCKHGLERNAKFYERDMNAYYEEYTNWNNAHDKWEADGGVGNEPKEPKEPRRRDYSGLTGIFDTDDTGMSIDELEAQASDYIDEFEDKVGDEDINKLWMHVNAMTDYSLNKSYVSGLISKDQYDSVSAMFEYYVPLRGFAEATADDVYSYVSRSDNPTNKTLKKAKGRTSKADAILATMMNMAHSAIVQGNKNNVAQAMLDLAIGHPGNGLLSVSERYVMIMDDGSVVPMHPNIDASMTPEEMRDEINRFNDEMKTLEEDGDVVKLTGNLKVNFRTQQWQEDEHAVRVMRDGKEYTVWVNGNPNAAQAINGILNPDSGNQGAAMRFLMWTMRAMAGNVTSRNPEFVLRNLARDIESASLIGRAKDGELYKKHLLENFRRNIGIGKFKTGDSIYTLFSKYESDQLDMSDERQRFFYEFMKNGGETGYSQLLKVDDYEGMIKSEVARAKGGTYQKIASALETCGEWVESANRGVENATRFAAYMASRQAGKTILESIADAKEISVNFNRKGSGAMMNQMFRGLYMFINPAIQGTIQYIKATKAHPSRMIKSLAQVATLGFMMPAINIALAALCEGLGCGGDDDYEDLEDVYKHIKDIAAKTYFANASHKRRNNFCLYISNDIFITIPLPQEIRAIYGMGDIVWSMALGMEPREDAMLALTSQLTQLLPVDIVDAEGLFTPGESGLASAVSGLVPSGLKGAYEAFVTNEDFSGRAITKQEERNENLPEYKRVPEDTPEWLVWLSRTWNNLTGGNDWKKSPLDSPALNPAAVEHIATGFLGGLVSFPMKCYRTLAMSWNEDMRELRNVPIVGSFATSVDNDFAQSRVMNEKYKYYQNEYEVTKSQIEGVNTETRSGDNTNKWILSELYNNGDWQRYEIFKNYEKAMKKSWELYYQADDSGNKKEKEKAIASIHAMQKSMIDKLDNVQPASGDMPEVIEQTTYDKNATEQDTFDDTTLDIRIAEVAPVYYKWKSLVYKDKDKAAEYRYAHKDDIRTYLKMSRMRSSIKKMKSKLDIKKNVDVNATMAKIRRTRKAAISEYNNVK